MVQQKKVVTGEEWQNRDPIFWACPQPITLPSPSTTARSPSCLLFLYDTGHLKCLTIVSRMTRQQGPKFVW